jgi:hypothetical protein
VPAAVKGEPGREVADVRESVDPSSARHHRSEATSTPRGSDLVHP